MATSHDLEPRPIDRILRPFHKFASQEASGGIVLLACTLVALVLANSPLREGFEALLHTPIGVHVGSAGLSMSLLHWISDGLMSVFFFVIGLEIKREIQVGELSQLKQAALPIAAAIGGMIVPAAIYVAINWGTEGARGWAIPMATDIAFALGILALLGRRVPSGLRVFLAALAIVDDLGAVLVIALFFTSGLQVGPLLAALVIWLMMLGLNRAGARSVLPYLAGSIALWFAIHASGLHSTIAGVLAAWTIPSQVRVDSLQFLLRTRSRMDSFAAEMETGDSRCLTETQEHVVTAIERDIERASSPLQRWMHALHPWTSFAIMPLFALANAGVAIDHDSLARAFSAPIALGVALGLLVGKPLGVMLFSYAAVRAGLAELPSRVNWTMLLGTGLTAGIGFTMSLFITALKMGSDPVAGPLAKTGVLGGSLLAGTLGTLILRWAFHRTRTESSLLQ